MTPEIYNKIKEVLQPLETAGIIKGLTIWNKQIARKDYVLKSPYAYVEFMPMKYDEYHGHIEEIKEPQVTIHILDKFTVDGEEDKMFVPSQEVYKAMKQAGARRIMEDADHGHDQVIDFQAVYELPTILDYDAVPETVKRTKPPIGFS